MGGFDFCGLAPLSDFHSEEWRSTYQYLDADQRDFHAHEAAFRSPDYKWPRHPLHTWSRVWEYPFVYAHMNAARLKSQNAIKAVDFGSGVTFFPFSVARRLECDVSCIDVDPIVEIDVCKAATVISSGKGSVTAVASPHAVKLIPDNSQDIVYCISVLEHIREREQILEEIERILKPAGTLILTFDMDLRGNFELAADEFYRLQKKLALLFDQTLPERTVHPSDLLTNINSPMAEPDASPAFVLKQLLKNIRHGSLLRNDPRFRLHLSVYGGVYSKH
jgi:2-polyprenyl-3-methyl-5-hydroxy-6-metoxy-1,4-benzoquinol methylase